MILNQSQRLCPLRPLLKSYLNEVVEESQGNDYAEKDRSAVADDSYCTQHREEVINPTPQHVGQDVVDGFYVSRRRTIQKKVDSEEPV